MSKRRLEEFRVLAGVKPLPFPWHTKSTRKQLHEQNLLEYSIYVDSSGMAHDDEGNKWQVDKWEWPEGEYSGNDARRLSMIGGDGGGYSDNRMSSSDQKYWEARAGRLLAALILKGRKTDFIRSIVSKKIRKGYPFTYKQRAAFEKTEGYMKSTFAKMPTKGWALTSSGQPLLTSPFSSKAQAWLDSGIETEPKGKDFIIKGKGAKPAPAPKAAKKATASSSDEQADVIRKAMKKRSDPFLTTVLKAMETEKDWRKGVSSDTLKGIRHQLYKRGMRKEADLFR
jgi:hypothetical protein